MAVNRRPASFYIWEWSVRDPSVSGAAEKGRRTGTVTGSQHRAASVVPHQLLGTSPVIPYNADTASPPVVNQSVMIVLRHCWASLRSVYLKLGSKSNTSSHNISITRCRIPTMITQRLLVSLAILREPL